jgi:hypothetical protein
LRRSRNTGSLRRLSVFNAPRPPHLPQRFFQLVAPPDASSKGLYPPRHLCGEPPGVLRRLLPVSKLGKSHVWIWAAVLVVVDV